MAFAHSPIATSLMLHGALGMAVALWPRPVVSSYGAHNIVKIGVFDAGSSHSSGPEKRQLHGTGNSSQQQKNHNGSGVAAAGFAMSPGTGATAEAPGQSAQLLRESVVEPAFTADALRRRFRGMLVLDLDLDESGRVIRASLLNPTGLEIDAEALASARQAVYRPARDISGRPVASKAELRFDFTGH